MIDLNSTIINSSTVELTADIQDASDEQQDNAIDTNSFLLLMAEIIATLPVNNVPTPNPTTPEDPIQTSAAKIEEQLPDELSAVNSNEPKQSEPDKLKDNVAMAWINSASFEPPQANIEPELGKQQIIESAQNEPPKVAAELNRNDNRTLKELALDASAKIPVLHDKAVTDELVSKEEIFAKHEFIVNSNLETALAKEDEFIKEVDLSNLFLDDNKEDLVGFSKTNSSAQVAHKMMVNEKIVPEPIFETKTSLPLADTLSPNLNFNETPPSPQLKTINIPTEINSPQWVDQFSERIIWLENQGIKSALIKLNPEDLGPLEINIKVVKDTASVSISSPNTQVRDLVDHALPRLREMMEAQGLNLGEVQISADANTKHSAQHGQHNLDPLLSPNEEIVEVTTIKSRTTKGLIDYFA